MCSGSVAEVIQSVVNGADGCIFCFGHANLGTTPDPEYTPPPTLNTHHP